ncbi:hypothetical protein B0T16DRAFT_456629 [Cercophora newfieldiana]|uniref:Uncharacterized protein n=1 Tax=Cercophora newfieldiana TaxID=92897 RepID=A0AA39YCZ9_9PEZI|nr:hypothetical protein B0T16DRAFT_456629 [Cercophora newfieldiana]
MSAAPRISISSIDIADLPLVFPELTLSHENDDHIAGIVLHPGRAPVLRIRQKPLLLSQEAVARPKPRHSASPVARPVTWGEPNHAQRRDSDSDVSEMFLNSPKYLYRGEYATKFSIDRQTWERLNDDQKAALEEIANNFAWAADSQPLSDSNLAKGD